MNEAEKKELLSALKLIRAVCEKQTNCEDCPLSCNYDECSITKALPSNWNLIDDEPNWRAFKE